MIPRASHFPKKLRPLMRYARGVRRVFTDADYVVFPREGEGLNYSLNWSMCADGVAPPQRAFGNSESKKLLALSRGQTAVEKACEVRLVNNGVSYDEFEEFFEKTKSSLMLCNDLFVHDGAVGSAPRDSTRVRVITDCPLVSLFAQNLLVKVPTTDPHTTRQIIIYVAALGENAGTDPEGQMLIEEEFDKPEPNDKEGVIRARVAFTGGVSRESVKDAIVFAKRKLMQTNLDRESILLPCDTMISSGKTALVFGASNETVAEGIKTKVCYAAHNVIWNNGGLTSMFTGANIPSDMIPPVFPSKVAPFESNGVTTLRIPADNMVPHPSAALFMTKGAKGILELSGEDIDGYLKKCAPELTDQEVDSFRKRVETHKVKVYVVSKETEIFQAFLKAQQP